MADASKRWGTPDSVFQCTETMQRVETARAYDRARVDALANGSRPYTEAEMKEFQHQLNVNWLELTRKLQDATGQINNAFLPAGNFFTCNCLKGDPAKRAQYGQVFTAEINRILKKKQSGKKFHYLLRSRNASVALHGIGPLLWTNSRRLFPRFIPLEDLLLPTDTLLDFGNLSYFAVNLYLTPGELVRMALLNDANPGWDKQAVKNILKDLHDAQGQLIFTNNASDIWERPEYIQELYRQNSGYLESDAVPRVRLRSFYYQSDKADNQKWYRRVILRDNMPSQAARGDQAKFIYDGKAADADSIDKILHCQFGDNSLVSPLKYHSVRGIGTMLYAPAMVLNRLRSQAVQHVFQNLLTLWRINDPNDRDRAKQILLLQHGVVPEGASIIPQQERHQIDPRLLDFGISQMKQNIAENASSFTPDVDTGTQKEMTAFETGVRLQAANTMVGNVLGMMYPQEVFFYEELVRRALIKTTDDPLAEDFQKQCKAKGIPKELMSDECWNVIAERVLGAGDNAIAQTQANMLMSQIQQFEPESQRKIKRLWTSTTLNDPERAADLVPEAPDQSTSGTRAAEDIYATLMRGIPVPMRKGIDHVGYCAALLAMMQGEIQRILGTDGMGTPEDIIGFQTVAASITENLQFLAMDERNKSTVKELSDVLGKLMNEVKAMAQRQQEAAAAAQQPQPDPEAMAKAQTMTMLAETKAQLSQMQAEQKLMQAEQRHRLQMQQQAEAHNQRLQAEAAKTEATLVGDGMKAASEVRATQIKADADARATETKAQADVSATAAKTAADVMAAKQREKAAPKEKSQDS